MYLNFEKFHPVTTIIFQIYFPIKNYSFRENWNFNKIEDNRLNRIIKLMQRENVIGILHTTLLLKAKTKD